MRGTLVAKPENIRDLPVQKEKGNVIQNKPLKQWPGVFLDPTASSASRGSRDLVVLFAKVPLEVEVVSMWQSQEQQTAGLETLISPKAFCRVHCFFWIPGAATCLFQVLNKDVLNEFSGRNCLPYPTCCYCGEMLAGKLFWTECKAYVVCSLFRHTPLAFACPMAGGAALLNLPELQPSTIPGVGPESRSQLLGEQVGGKSSQQLWQNCTVA